MPSGYFKEVSLAGHDFDRGVKVELGAWVPTVGRLRMRLGGGYVVADRVTETAGAGEWPCRAYRVEVPDGDWPHIDAHIIRVPTYRPIAEIESWEVLGPQGREVSAVFDRAGRLTVAEVVRLASTTPDPWQSMFKRASTVVAANGRVVEAAARHGALMAAAASASAAVKVARAAALEDGSLTSDALVVALLAFMEDPEIAPPTERSHSTSASELDAILYNRASLAVFFAAWGYVLRDLLTNSDFEAVAGRWITVVGEPDPRT